MKLEVDVNKRTFLVIFLGIMLSIGGVFVIAQSAPNPGHGASSVSAGTFSGSGDWRFNGKLGINKAPVSGVDLDVNGKINSGGDVSGNRLCIGNDCRSSWPSGGGSSGSCTQIGQLTASGALTMDVPASCVGKPCNLVLTVSSSDGGAPSAMAMSSFVQGISGIDSRWWMSDGMIYAGSGGSSNFANTGRQGSTQDTIISASGLGGASVYDDYNGEGGDNSNNNQFVLHSQFGNVVKLQVCN